VCAIERGRAPGITLERFLAVIENVSILTARAFGWGKEGTPHNKASVLHVLRRQALDLRSARLAGDGSSYTALVLFLAAARRALGLPINARHWAAALRNVAAQDRCEPGKDLGMELGTPSERFKLLLDDAIDAAGLGRRATPLDEHNRRIALGLAVNWGMRSLLAYALAARAPRKSTRRARRDLVWLRSVVQKAMDA
jgi:hypothetical protein